jgi:hypothetical protein
MDYYFWTDFFFAWVTLDLSVLFVVFVLAVCLEITFCYYSPLTANV